MCPYCDIETEDWQQKYGCIYKTFYCNSNLSSVSLHRAITKWLLCSIVWQALRSGWVDVDAAIVSCRATSCRLPGPHPSDVVMIWHTWSKAPFFGWCAFCFSRAPARISIDLAGRHSQQLMNSFFKCEDAERRLNIKSVPTNGLSLKWSVSCLTGTSIQKTRYIP